MTQYIITQYVVFDGGEDELSVVYSTVCMFVYVCVGMCVYICVCACCRKDVERNVVVSMMIITYV